VRANGKSMVPIHVELKCTVYLYQSHTMICSTIFITYVVKVENPSDD
jgi:hypothetical protein